MRTVFLLRRLRAWFDALGKRLARFRLPIGAASALLFAGAFALASITCGPLYNLNDIGSFRIRVLFITMASSVLLMLMLGTALLPRTGVYRMLLRQMIVLVGFLLLLTGINQKTYFYTENLQPLVRAMDGAGLGALAGWKTNLSAPAATLLFFVTRGPVYDMYSFKLLCVGAYMALALMTAYIADRRLPCPHADALLTLTVILPQGFLSAGCTALPDTVCLALLAGALLLAAAPERSKVRARAACALFGLACAMSGLAFYALPIWLYLTWKRRLSVRELAGALALPAACCLPAIVCGVPAMQAFSSLLHANLALPEYAAGAPGFLSLIPRAAVEEMPIMAWMRHLPEIDAVTNAQPYYTQAHFEQASLGLTIAGAAVYGAVVVWLVGKHSLSVPARAFALVLTALLVCPGVTNAAWIAASMTALYVLFADRRLRLPACMVLFSACCSAVYPMAEELLLPMAAAFVLNLCALLMALDIIPVSLRAEA